MTLSRLVRTVTVLTAVVLAPAVGQEARRSPGADLAFPPLGLVAPGKGKAVAVTPDGGGAARYADKGDPDSPLNIALRKARLLLWVTSPVLPPRELLPDLLPLRKEVRPLPRTWLARYDIPAAGKAEERMKQQVMGANRELARLAALLEEAAEGLRQLHGQRDKAGPRGQAQYDLTLAWLTARLAYIEEHGLALGTLRKEAPAYDPARHKAWQLKPTARIHDGSARRLAKEAAKGFEKVERDHPGTPWAQLAKYGRTAELGLTWEAVP